MKMGQGWEPWPSLRKKGNPQLVKLFISALLVGISFRLLCSHYNAFLPASAPTTAALSLGADDVKDGSFPRGPQLADKSDNQDSVVPETALDINQDIEEYSHKGPQLAGKSGNQDAVVPETTLDINDEYPKKGKCDLFTGEWIPNPLGPAYTNTTCPFIETPQNCIKNGRPDTGYLYWRWKPHDCDVPLFDAKKILDAMRNKSWAMIGDSIFRNHAQSLLCLLAKAEEPVEVYHADNYKSRRWHFHSHNFTLSLIWAPLLVKADIFEDDDGKSKSEIQLHLDSLNSKWTSQYHTFDYIVISGGQWFLKQAIYLENNTVVGCHSCYGKNITELGTEYPYRKVLGRLYNFIAASDHKPLIIYRTWAPSHFENGLWYTGGNCNRTEPYREGEFNGTVMDPVMRRIELEEFEKAAANLSENGANLKLLDTYHLTLLRPDGHSGPYRNFHPFGKANNAAIQYDCLHWCLPGPLDSWNDLIMELLLNG